MAIAGLVLVFVGMQGSYEFLLLGAILGLFALPGAALSRVLIVRYARSRGVTTQWVSFGCVILCLFSLAVGPVIVSGCSPDCAAWTGSNAGAIDAGVDQMNLDEVGEVVCDYRRPTSFGGNQAHRFIGIDGARNVDAVVDMLREAGYKRGDSEPSGGTVYLARDGLEVSVSPTTDEESVYGFGHCVTPDHGAVVVDVTVR